MGIQQMMIGGAGFVGAPQNQSGGVNSTFQPNGTNTITTGTNATPVNWMSVAPQPGIGSFYWIRVTDTGLASGTAAALTGAAVSGWVTLASNPAYTIPSGIGARNFSYQISSDSGGATIVASGTGNVNNSI